MFQQPDKQLKSKEFCRRKWKFLPTGALLLGGTVLGVWLFRSDLPRLALSSPEQSVAPERNKNKFRRPSSPLGEIRPLKEGFQPVTVIPNAFPPIQGVPHVAADKAGGIVRDEELVLGVVINEQARAYPINTLTGPQREIINDRIDGVAIAATW